MQLSLFDFFIKKIENKDVGFKLITRGEREMKKNLVLALLAVAVCSLAVYAEDVNVVAEAQNTATTIEKKVDSASVTAESVRSKGKEKSKAEIKKAENEAKKAEAKAKAEAKKAEAKAKAEVKKAQGKMKEKADKIEKKVAVSTETVAVVPTTVAETIAPAVSSTTAVDVVVASTCATVTK